jgi:hypothetical protein
MSRYPLKCTFHDCINTTISPIVVQNGNVELWRVAINIDFDPVKALPASCSPNNRVIATTLAKVVHNIYRFTSLNDFNFDPHIEQFGFQVLIEQSN